MNDASVVQVDRTTSPSRKRDVVNLQIDLVLGDITDADAPVAVCPYQDGVPLAGSAKTFDQLLDSWLTQAIEFQMIGGRLGQLFVLSLEQFKPTLPITIGELLIVGLGEPGQLAPDDLRFFMSNVTTAVKSKGFSTFATNLVGTRRRELSISEAERSLVEGVLDGYQRLRALAETST
jgi:hypothetical protein